MHAIDNGHESTKNGPILPDKARILLDLHEERLERIKQQDIYEAVKRMQDAWGIPGSKKRHTAEQAFLHQLDHDPLYSQGRPARESFTWFLYTIYMDPEHV